MPLVSVIIPAYNSEQTITAAIESVRQQTLTDYEIIVINDGSTDGTLQQLNAIEDDRLTIFSYENSGVSASRNRGITQATGQFVAFLDADDVWLPNKLVAQVQALEADPTAAVAYSWVDYIDRSGKSLRSGMHPTVSGDVYRQILQGSFLECGSNPLVQKSAIDQVGGFDESLNTAEDWEMWVRLAACYRFVVVPQVDVLYRVSTQSGSFKLRNHRLDGVTVIERIFALAPNDFRGLKRKSLSNFYKYLTFKVLTAPKNSLLGRSEAMFASRCLFLSVANDPAMLKQIRVLMSALVKIAQLSIPRNHSLAKPTG